MSHEQHRRVDLPSNFQEAKGFYWHELMSTMTPHLKDFQELVRNSALEAREATKPRQKALIKKMAQALQTYIELSAMHYRVYLAGSQGFYITDAIKQNGIDPKVYGQVVEEMLRQQAKDQAKTNTRTKTVKKSRTKKK